MVTYMYCVFDRKKGDGTKMTVMVDYKEGLALKSMPNPEEFDAGEDYVNWIKKRAMGDFELFDDRYKGVVTFEDGEVVAVRSRKGQYDGEMGQLWMGIEYDTVYHTDVELYECNRCEGIGCEYCRPIDFVWDS